MKRYYIIILLLSFCSLAFAQSSDFDKFSDMKGVTSIHVSKTMLQMMSKTETKGTTLNSLAPKMESLSIFSGGEAEVIARMKEGLSFLNKKNGYEELMRLKEKGEDARIFIKKQNGGATEYALLTETASSFHITVITGTLTLEEIRGFATQLK